MQPESLQLLQHPSEPELMDEMKLDPVKMLLELRDGNVRMETKIDIYLGKDGIVPAMQKRLDAMNTRMAMFTGGGMVLMWLINHLPQLGQAIR